MGTFPSFADDLGREFGFGRVGTLGFAQRLRSTRPVGPQGMALALLLLTDPERPLYGIATTGELSSAISEARERLARPAAEERRSPPLPPIKDREPKRRRRP